MEEENVFYSSELIFQKLSFLNYESQFMAKKHTGMILPRDYFALNLNSNEQIDFLKSLCKWLFSLIKKDAPTLSSYSDPLTIATNILNELQAASVTLPAEINPSKIKSGNGIFVCKLLNCFIDEILKSLKVVLRVPVFAKAKEETKREKENTDEVEEEVGSVNLNDSVDETAGMALEDLGTTTRQVIETNADENEWYAECERIAAKLVISQPTDRNEWRRHVDMTKNFSGIISKLNGSVFRNLEKVAEQIEKGVDKILTSENVLNNAFSDHFAEIKQSSERKKEIDSKIKTYTQKIKELNDEYSVLNNKNEEVQRKINEHNENATNDEPLLKIKKVIDDLKVELTKMDIHIGVLSNSIMKKEIKERDGGYFGNTQKSRNNELDIDDNSIEELV